MTEMNTTNRTQGLFGLVLAGGQSSRMGEDKALLKYHTQTQLEHTYHLLNKYCEKTFVSVSETLAKEESRLAYPLLVDQFDQGGPLMGIASALHTYPDKAWLVVACDLPFLDESTLDYLIEQRQMEKDASAFISDHDGLPEPLCAIWEPRIYTRIETAFQEQRFCPRKILIQANTELLPLPSAHALDNANTPEERQRIQNSL